MSAYDAIPSVFLGFYAVHAHLRNVLTESERAMVSNWMRKYLLSMLQGSPLQIVSYKTSHDIVKESTMLGILGCRPSPPSSAH